MVDVQTNDVFDSDIYTEFGFVTATVVSDVMGPDKQVAVPANSIALLIVRAVTQQGTLSRVVFGLNRIGSSGKVFKAASGVKDIATVWVDEDSVRGAEVQKTCTSRSIVSFLLSWTALFSFNSSLIRIPCETIRIEPAGNDLHQRGERVERSFAHMYETGGIEEST